MLKATKAMLKQLNDTFGFTDVGMCDNTVTLTLEDLGLLISAFKRAAEGCGKHDRKAVREMLQRNGGMR